MKSPVFVLNLVFLTIFFIAVASAEPLAVEIEPLQELITPGEVGEYYIYLTNNEYQTKEIEIKTSPSSSVLWRIKSDPTVIKVPSLSKAVAKLYIEPLSDNKPSSQETKVIDLSFWSLSGQKVEAEYKLKIIYIEGIKLIYVALSPEKLDPRKKYDIFQIQLKNNYETSINNLLVSIKSKFLDDNFVVNLKPLEEKIFDFNVNPVLGPLVISFSREGIHLFDLTKEIEFITYSDIKENIFSENGLLIDRFAVVKTNEGNSAADIEYKLDISTAKKWFTDISPEPDEIVKGGVGYTMIWRFNLKPNEEYKISMITSYTGFLLILLVACIVLAWLGFYLTRNVKVSKKVSVLKDVGVFDMEITLNVKNRSWAELKDIKIFDRLPHVIAPTKEFGTMKPDSIRKGKVLVQKNLHFIFRIILNK